MKKRKPLNLTSISFPSDVRKFMRIPSNVTVPVEMVMAMGYVATLIYAARKSRSSRYYKAAMLVESVSLDFLPNKNGSKKPVIDDSWISVNYLNSKGMGPRKAALRNFISARFLWDNKPYRWSGIINHCVIPGCDSRFSLGKRSKLYGAIKPAYSKGIPYYTGLRAMYK